MASEAQVARTNVFWPYTGFGSRALVASTSAAPVIRRLAGTVRSSSVSTPRVRRRPAGRDGVGKVSGLRADVRGRAGMGELRADGVTAWEPRDRTRGDAVRPDEGCGAPYVT